MASEDKVTKLESLLAEERRARIQAEQLLAKQNVFIHSLATQMKTPLYGVLGLCEAMGGEEAPVLGTEAFGYIRMAAHNLQEIVSDLLDYSKLEQGQVETDKRSVNLREFTKSVLEEVVNLTGDKGLWLESLVSPGVPRTVQVDPKTLGRVLRNLLSNAIKFTPTGSVRLGVALVQENVYRFSVRDTGVGISSDALPNLFEPFSSKRRQGGGLGLAVAAKLTQVLGGLLKVKSEVREGTEFWFDLELSSDSQESEWCVGEPTQKLEILLVEDEEITQQIVLRLLESLGHSVALASDGTSALKLLEDNSFDLIFMDLQMPPPDGLETTRRIRSLERELKTSPTPIVALTAALKSSRRRECLEAGMDGYLIKPIRKSELMRVLSQVKPRVHKSHQTRSAGIDLERPARVLVVEDEPTNRKVLKNTLTAAGHQVFEAINGQHALRVLQEEDVDLILLDAVMPVMDGFETCSRIKSDRKLSKIPVLFVTSLENRAERIRAMDAGASDFLSKPVDTRLLKIRVRNAVKTKYLIDEVEESYEQLEAMEKLRDELAHMVVHDMRGPLTGILGYTQLLGFSELGRGEREYLSIITSLCSVLREMVSSIIDLNRLESHELQLKIAPVDVVALAQREVDMMKFLHDSEVVLRAPESIRVECDGELLRRVLANLLNNASKYSPSDRPIEVQVREGKSHWRMEVRDYGPGVPVEFREKIFDKFAQVESGGERKLYSSGLGLAFCRLAVEQHGGRIGVETPESGGSLFWLEVPVGSKDEQKLVANLPTRAN